MLSHVRRIDSLAQLVPFLSRASLLTFEATYASASLDVDSVDNDLREEIFRSP
jgi:hypothetical protein